MPSRRAFTLVELLVTIGIIALLLAILLPVTSRARAQARSSACKAQLTSIGHAVQMYLNYNKNRYPPAPALPSVNPYNLPTLMTYLNPYLDNVERVWQCPSDENLFPTEKTSFFYYNELGERRLEETFLYRIMRSSSNVPVLWDAANYHGGTVPYNWLFADGHVDQFLSQGNSGSKTGS